MNQYLLIEIVVLNICGEDSASEIICPEVSII